MVMSNFIQVAICVLYQIDSTRLHRSWRGMTEMVSRHIHNHGTIFRRHTIDIRLRVLACENISHFFVSSTVSQTAKF